MISRYTTGNSVSATKSVVTMPPMITTANGRCVSLPTAWETAIGIRPRIASRAAITSARNRSTGPSTSACSSGAHALGEAFEWIRRGRAQIMVTGGAEATVTPVGIGGFEAMFALSRRNDEPTRASRPFDKGRDGFLCGEGSGILVLESLERAKKRGAKIYAEVTGYGASSDAHHITQPAPEGEGAQRAMRMALRDAKVSPSDIGYINAHGTSTPQGDIQEATAIRHVFGEQAGKVSISSTKSSMGHLLGAAGAVEAAICALAIDQGRFGWDDYQRLGDTAINAIADKIDVVQDDRLEVGRTHPFGARVTVTTEDGVHEELYPDPSGEPTSFPDAAAMRQKFLTLARPVLDRRAETFADAILSLETYDRASKAIQLGRQ